ncbi:MAG: M23 family metallopeptidase [Proteobacteria bacterium]|nr:M23 family metallopeptidase [Pseudomonadota bacterium]MBU1059348.1 M23 family metallopeptidase [Pseudomonadota bacterium]
MVRLKQKSNKNSLSTRFLLIISLLFLAAAAYGYVTYFEGEIPTIQGKDLPAYIGSKTVASLSIADQKSGLRNIRIVVAQGDTEKEVFSKEFPRKGNGPIAGPKSEKVLVELDPKSLGLQEGEAILKAQVRDFSFRGLLKGNLSEFAQPIVIDTKAPQLSIIHSERYIEPGGSGIVIYRVDDSVKHGVMFNGDFHPGFPLTDGSDNKYISYIALRYSAKTISESTVFAEDAAGNRSVKGFIPELKDPHQKKDRINIPDSFLSRKIPEFEEHYPEMKGDLLQKYLYANREVREMNNQKIHDLCMNQTPKQLWSGRFLRMPGSSRAGFADHRTYYYNETAIDQQVHLGMDIASTQHAEIKAAGTGTVIFADYIGIYGNMVMLDHGQGVYSLYSHLSETNVTPGTSLNQGDRLGYSGMSGMAGGDHLHFSMLINGIFVTPKEWWDQHWITVTIDEPVSNAKF